MSNPKLPFVPAALLGWLEKQYPDRAPSMDMSEREVWMAAGQAELIRKLRVIAAGQSETTYVVGG